MAYMPTPTPSDVTTLRPEDVARLRKEIEVGQALLSGAQVAEGDEGKKVSLGAHPDETDNENLGAILATVVGSMLLMATTVFTFCMMYKSRGQSSTTGGMMPNRRPNMAPGQVNTI